MIFPSDGCAIRLKICPRSTKHFQQVVSGLQPRAGHRAKIGYTIKTMVAILYATHIVVAIFLILVVLLQQGKGSDMGAAFGGASSTVFGGASGRQSFLVKVTIGLAAVFMLLSLGLSWRASYSQKQQQRGAIPPVQSAPSPMTPGAAAPTGNFPNPAAPGAALPPTAPTAPSPAKPAAPKAPATPQGQKIPGK